MIASRESAAEILAAQPFSRLVGARLTEFAPGTAVLEVDIADHLRQQYGLVHGGVLAYLVDNAISFAAGTALGPSLVSTGFAVELVGNTREGRLRAVGTVVHAAAGQAVCAVEVSAIQPDGSTRVCAIAQGSAAVTG
jgi:uncharacterized protein (TIGR00369 family)